METTERKFREDGKWNGPRVTTRLQKIYTSSGYTRDQSLPSIGGPYQQRLFTLNEETIKDIVEKVVSYYDDCAPSDIKSYGIEEGA